MTKRILILSCSFLLLVSCDKKSDKAPRIIESASQEAIDAETTVTKELASIGLNYQANYKTYGSATPIEACENKQQAILQDSEAKLAKIEEAMAAESNLYRDQALVFYRKTQDQRKSLNQINSLLQPYCDQDDKQAKACVSDTNPIFVHINPHVTTYMVVQPFLVPNKDKKIGILLLSSYQNPDQDDDTIRTHNFKEAKETQHYTNVLPEIGTVPQLQKIFECLSEANLKSDIGKKIKATAKVSFQSGRRDCLIEKGRVDEAKRKSIEEKVNYSYPISEKTADYCGVYLK